MFEAITNFDFRILDWIQLNWKCPALDFLMPIITLFGEYGIFWISIAVAFLFFRKTRKTGLQMGVALILGLFVCNCILKPLVARDRPFLVVNGHDVEKVIVGFKMLVRKLYDYSFPSGHTIASFEAATVLMIRDKKFGIPALVIAVLVSFSRIYLYMHYPTDVFAAVILGTLFGIIGVLVIEKTWHYIEKFIDNLIDKVFSKKKAD